MKAIASQILSLLFAASLLFAMLAIVTSCY